MAAAANILIVEDEEELLDIMSMTVKAYGYGCHEAADGVAALKLISETAFDLILCDLNMPQMGGVLLLEEVRRRGLQTPFIFLTGDDSETARRHAIRLGAAGFLQKPFNLDLLRSTIERTAGSGRAA